MNMWQVTAELLEPVCHQDELQCGKLGKPNQLTSTVGEIVERRKEDEGSTWAMHRENGVQSSVLPEDSQ